MVACCSTPAQAASTLALCSATNVAGLPGALASGVAGEPVDSAAQLTPILTTPGGEDCHKGISKPNPTAAPERAPASLTTPPRRETLKLPRLDPKHLLT